MTSLTTRERPPRVLSGRMRPGAHVEASGLVVRMWPQGAAGNASQAQHALQSGARHAAAWGSVAAEAARHTVVITLAAAWDDSLGQEQTVMSTVSHLHLVCFSGLQASAVVPLDAPALVGAQVVPQ